MVNPLFALNPAVASAGITAVSSLAGKLLGGGKSKSLGEQYQAQERTETQRFHNKMSLAKMYKIHPLAMLGAQMPQAGGAVYDNTSDNMGQNIAGAISQGASSYFTAQANKERIEIELENGKLQNELLKSQISSINTQNTGRIQPISRSSNSNMGQVDVVPHETVSKNENDTGQAAGTPPAMVEYDLGNGQTVELLYSQEGPSEGIESLPFPLKHIKMIEILAKRARNPLISYNERKKAERDLARLKKERR